LENGPVDCFGRGKALKERAFPYPVVTSAASSRLRKGGLNIKCIFLRELSANLRPSYNPFGHTS
ncbi:MAG: hypothetical protein J5956_12685, partial [Ruminococcus sp.]|nr:hypothetical protein [Ruminococcus sp.]